MMKYCLRECLRECLTECLRDCHKPQRTCARGRWHRRLYLPAQLVWSLERCEAQHALREIEGHASQVMVLSGALEGQNSPASLIGKHVRRPLRITNQSPERVELIIQSHGSRRFSSFSSIVRFSALGVAEPWFGGPGMGIGTSGCARRSIRTATSSSHAPALSNVGQPGGDLMCHTCDPRKSVMNFRARPDAPMKQCGVLACCQV